MRHEHLRPLVRGNQPVARQRDSIHLRHIVALRLLPFLKVDGARKGRQHDELRERETGPLGKIMCGVKRVRAIAGQAEDERTKNMHAVIGKRLELLYQIVARQVEILVDRFQAFGGNGFHAHQRPLIRAFFMASRNPVSSAASMVICVKKVMSLGSSDSRSISSKRSSRMASS